MCPLSNTRQHLFHQNRRDFGCLCSSELGQHWQRIELLDLTANLPGFISAWFLEIKTEVFAPQHTDFHLALVITHVMHCMFPHTKQQQTAATP